RGAVEKRPAPPEQEGEERESEPGQPGDKQVAERLVVTHVARVLPFPPVPGRGAWNLEAPHDGVRHGIGEDEQEGDDEQGQRGRRDGQRQAGALPSHAPSEKDGDLPSESGQRGQDREDGARPQRQGRALTGGARARRAAWPYAAAQAKAVSASTPRRPQAVSRQSGEGAPAASIRVRTADTTRPVTGRS